MIACSPLSVKIPGNARPPLAWLGFLMPLLLGVSAGCNGGMFRPFGRPDVPRTEVNSLVLGPGGFQAEEFPKDDEFRTQMRGAHELFRQEKYKAAARSFKYVATAKKAPPDLVQEALYYRAECLRLQGYYPSAADVYADLLNKYNHLHTPYREQAVQHLYDIADYWLDETREEMHEKNAEPGKDKKWFAWASRIFHFERTKPFLDVEGRAIQALENVITSEPTGPLAPHALFLCGSVNLYRQRYSEADLYFTRIYTHHRKTPLAPKAIELAIFCKQMSTGGPLYDGRKVAEARELVQAAFTYEELADSKRDFLRRQLTGITLQQAAKDYEKAELWRRTGHTPSAYFYYEIVRRRYPGTKYADLAAKKMQQIRAELEKSQHGQPVLTHAAPLPAQPLSGAVETGRPEKLPQPREAQADESEELPPPRELPPLPGLQPPVR
jgi:TolA-binding protein